MNQPLIPITFQEHLQLTDVGISADAVTFDTLTMESDKFICVRETIGDLSDVVIIDMDDVGNPKRRAIHAEAAIMHPLQNIIALKGTNSLKIYNLETKSRIKAHTMDQDVIFMRWISLNILALVTENSVFHWSMEGDSTPVKVCDIDASLLGCRIINYQTDNKQQWLLLTGLTPIPNRVVGAMQLFSVEWQCMHAFQGYTAAFATFKMDCNPEPSTLLCFAVRTHQSIRLNISELGGPPGKNEPFPKQAVDVYFPPEAQYDYPVAIQVSRKYDVAYLVTKFGYIHVYDIESAICICMHRISADTIFVTAPHTSSGGIIGVNHAGQVLSVAIDEHNIISYMMEILQNPELAMRFSIRNNLASGIETQKPKRKQKPDCCCGHSATLNHIMKSK